MDNNLAQSCMRIISCFMMPYIETEIKLVNNDQLDHLGSQIREFFFFAMTWSIGCTTNLAGREKFNVWLRERIQQSGMEFPEDKLIYDYIWDQDVKEWKVWHETIKEYVVDVKASYNEIVVPTLDSIRMKWMMKCLLVGNKHVMIPGPTGTGKSVYVAQLLLSELPEEFQGLQLTFSAQTSANQTQDYLDDKMTKRRTKVYGPEIGKKFVCFIDDLNMPKKEEYGAQPPIELVRQFMDHKGWYERKSKEKPFNKIEDMVILSAMGPPGGGRADITLRLQRHFNILTFTDLQNEAIKTIYSAIGTAFYSQFSTEVRDCLQPLVDAQLEIYDVVLNGPLKPTPSKQHYLFNLRDISRIYQGIVSADKKQVTQPVELLRLWIHENMRVFGDRLIEVKERKWMQDQLFERAKAKFALTYEEVFNSDRLIFGDFYDGIDIDQRVYKQIVDLNKMVEKIVEFLDEYNSATKTQMNLVMFLDACDHVCRISRVIRQPLGNSFLLGVGGSGRQSLSRLATFMSNYKIFQIEVVKGYAMMNWREDVKKVLMQAGVENKETTFLFVDTQIINEQMLEDINNILNGGDVPGLYKKEDFEDIDKVGRGLCIDKAIAVNKMNMFGQYVGRIKRNMHMIIAMSPLGGLFIERNRKFPSLINCSTIDWFSEWPEEALLGVGRGQIADIDLGEDLDACVEMFKVIHQSVEKESISFMDLMNRSNHVTPTSFLEQLNMYKDILAKKRVSVVSAKKRLEIGLDVMEKANYEIIGLQKQIDDMTPDLIKTKKVIEEVLVVVNTKKAAADIERDIVSKEEAEARQQETEAEELRAEAQAELDKAAPMLDEAQKVIRNLDKGELYTLASIQRPTETVVRMMELSCHMFGYKPKPANKGKVIGDDQGYFHLSKQNFLSQPAKFLDAMCDYDKENIPEATVRKVNAILENPKMTVDAIKSASQALLGVHKWSATMMKYHELLKIVNPRRVKVAQMKAELKIVREKLAQKMQQLAEVEETLAQLQAELDRNEAEGARLEAKITDCNTKLSRAGKIIEGLAGEKQRWTETVQELGKEYELLVGNSLIAAGMVAYGGAFTSKFRANLEEQWNKTIVSLGVKIQENCTMMKVLEDPVLTKTWTANSLPSDNLSIENALIMFRSRRWSLMIDPQNQAGKFIKSLSKDLDQAPQGLDVFKASDPQLLRNLEISIQFGRWTLIENMAEDLDPALDPILTKQIDKTGSLRLGDKLIPYNHDFKLFMVTTLPNPRYSPETQVKITILNFAITPFGLEEQMLNQFIMQEMPDLQKKKDAIVLNNAQALKTLRDIEEKILYNLTKNSEIKQILEDDTLINVLDESNLTGGEIKTRMAEAKITEVEIDKARESYRPIAFRVQILFFAIVDLAVIDPMYQYSLQWFSNLFSNSIENSQKAKEQEQRIQILNDHFTLNLYENICRSLFERHKLLFSFSMVIKILQGENKINATELRFLLAGPQGDIHIVENPTTWLDDLEWAETYKNLFAMSQLDMFKGFDKFFIEHEGEFQKIFDATEPQDMPLPGEWNKKLNSFQKMICLKAIRMDKLVVSIQNYICEHLGEAFITPPTFDISKSYKESSLTTPLVFILSKGADPNASFEGFAAKMNMTKKCKQVSLGRGQGEKAEMEINDKLQMGGWVLLMNCHLSTSWMPRLEAIVENLDDSKHRDFRLWLTSMPDKSFPVSVLQNSVKMTLEPPSGLKQNCLGTYQSIETEDFESCAKPQEFKKLMWGFVFFHAIVQDRRKFGPIGWNIPYAFMNEELTVCRRQLKIFIENYEFVPFKVLNYIGAEVNYGGRVTDSTDKRLIATILERYINPGILEDGYKFSESGLYNSIPIGEREDYLDYIKTMPLNPKPEAFGLHENAEITTSQLTVIDLISNMIVMQPRTSAGKGKTREEVIGEQAKFIQSKTRPVFNLEEVGKKFPVSYIESMNTVIFQECVRYNGLLAVMKSTLASVLRGLVGEIVMSEELELLANSIFDNQVPAVWSKVGFLSLKPLASWISDCNERIDFLNNWIEHGTPIKFWFSGFFFPQAFLTGTLQNYARKNKFPIDVVAYNYRVLDTITHEDINEAPEHGCYIYGLFLEGCKYDYGTHKLSESDPKKLFQQLPLMHLDPQKDRVKPETGIYNTPMYRVLSRTGTLSTTGHSTNFVIMLELPSGDLESKWIMAGVACFLSLRF